ncbi:MAG: hypothetical protein HQK50_04230 [Oligoflexia bacterium]|nr:hypothetical protein [Oligoflexia bacterium]MBF0364752.1 hypothetical protein [Oligoflexia bacterium]
MKFIAKTFILISVVVIGFTCVLIAQERESYEESAFKRILRKYLIQVEMVIHYPLAEKILGKSPEDIRIPELPEVVSNAKVVVEQQEKQVDLKISEEEKEKNSYYFIHEVYLVTLKRNPREEEVSKWMNTLGQGATREGIYRSIVLGTEYAELEQFREVMDQRVVRFATIYTKKYLGLELIESSFASFNSYSVKKYCVEKSLELIDAFLQNKQEEQLYDWYAVFSGDVAESFPKLWTGENRKQIYKRAHRNWASRVYFDWLKSEVIIKLHHVFNSMT